MHNKRFYTGDVVKFVGKRQSSWRQNDEHIIHECDYQGGGNFQYSTNKGAWFSSSDFELVKKANKESLAKLDKDLLDEEEEENEWL